MNTSITAVNQEKIKQALHEWSGSDGQILRVAYGKYGDSAYVLMLYPNRCIDVLYVFGLHISERPVSCDKRMKLQEASERFENKKIRLFEG